MIDVSVYVFFVEGGVVLLDDDEVIVGGYFDVWEVLFVGDDVVGLELWFVW